MRGGGGVTTLSHANISKFTGKYDNFKTNHFLHVYVHHPLQNNERFTCIMWKKILLTKSVLSALASRIWGVD